MLSMKMHTIIISFLLHLLPLVANSAPNLPLPPSINRLAKPSLEALGTVTFGSDSDTQNGGLGENNANIVGLGENNGINNDNNGGNRQGRSGWDWLYKDRMQQSGSKGPSIMKLPFNIGDNILSLFQKTDDEELLTTMLKEQCDKFDGTLVNNECYQYQSEVLPLFLAHFDCNSRGGTMWTPDLNDLGLFNKLMSAMPEIAGSYDETLWLNVFIDAEGHAYDSLGKNVTGSYLLKIDNNDDVGSGFNFCLVLKASTGAFFVESRDPMFCLVDDGYAHVCEYELDRPTTVLVKKQFGNIADWLKYRK